MAKYQLIFVLTLVQGRLGVTSSKLWTKTRRKLRKSYQDFVHYALGYVWKNQPRNKCIALIPFRLINWSSAMFSLKILFIMIYKMICIFFLNQLFSAILIIWPGSESSSKKLRSIRGIKAAFILKVNYSSLHFWRKWRNVGIRFKTACIFMKLFPENNCFNGILKMKT